jgi:DNA helicase-2/ATP-dependent DNA helicase PcrA
MLPQNYGGFPVTPQQARVVKHVLENPVTVVSAGAGSGKTYTLIAVVLALLDRGSSIDQFALITFTNEGAEELRRRLEEAMQRRLAQAQGEDKRFWRAQIEGLSCAYIGTIHGLCKRLLTAYGYGLYVARAADITFSTYQLTESIREAAKDYHDTTQTPILLRGPKPQYELLGNVKSIMEAAYNRGLDPAIVKTETEAQPDDAGKPYRTAMVGLISDAHSRYRAKKNSSQKFDAVDLLVMTARLLEGADGSDVAAKFGQRHKYLFIDEFQDTDRMQKRIAAALQPELARLLVVGDRKQAIYDFRGADSALLDQLADEYGVEVLPLNISGRPTKPLLDVQNALFCSIGNNPEYRILRERLEAREQVIIPQSGIPPLTLVNAQGVDTEARKQARLVATANIINSLLSRSIEDPKSGELRGVEPGDIVLLTRSNAVLSRYIAGLQPLVQATVRAEAGGQFYQRTEIVDTFRMLLLILDYPDVSTLSTALETAYLRHADPREREQFMLQYRTTEGMPLKDWLKDRHPAYHEAIQTLRAAMRKDTVPQIIGRLYEAFEIRNYYLNREDRQAAENLEKLREMARRLFKSEQALTLRQFVEHLRLDILLKRDESDARLQGMPDEVRPPYIRIMTVHRAKGLEFPLVIIPEVQTPLLNANNNPYFLLIPEYGLDVDLPTVDGISTCSARFQDELSSHQSQRLREEMRLLYVAVTRAQHAVFLIGSQGWSSRPNSPGTDSYSWQDEILRARTELTALGADFRSV